MRFLANQIRGQGNQHYTEVSLHIGQKVHPEKVGKAEMQHRPWRNESLVTLMGGISIANGLSGEVYGVC